MRLSLTPPDGSAPPPRRSGDRPALAELDRSSIQRRRNPGARRDEIRAARTADGIWDIVREEDEGTTWTVTHRPSGRDVPCYPSLRRARIAIASGEALREAEKRRARIEAEVRAIAAKR